jgi:hypothetical protein
MAMPKIEFRCQMFRGDWDQVWSQERMLFLMEALCRVNQTHLQEMEAMKKRGLVKNTYPSVYRSGLHYETEKGTEIWPDIPSLLEGTMGQGLYPGPWADCEDLACYRVAELRELAWHYARPSKFTKGQTECADPRFPQEESAVNAAAAGRDWPGWKKVKGGIKAMPFAKWRRGPQGQYHYHAILALPDRRLEDPSLVLGMGRERTFAEAGTAEKFKNGGHVVIQYAKSPDVMVVDPEKPSGYAGGKAKQLDAQVMARVRSGDTNLTEANMTGEDASFVANPVGDAISESGADLDAAIGWSRRHRKFVPTSVRAELRRLKGYANH